MSYVTPGVTLYKIPLTAVVANTTASIPANCYIDSIFIENTTANAVTGGVRIGTTDGGTDVVIALAVGANAILVIPAATLLKQVFSTSAPQTLYIQTVTLWNSASLTINIIYGKM